jgi:hypothetical protein
MLGLGSLCPRLFFLVFSLEVTHFFFFFFRNKKKATFSLFRHCPEFIYHCVGYKINGGVFWLKKLFSTYFYPKTLEKPI